MKLTQPLSLRLRLILLCLGLALVAWVAASLVAWQQTVHKIDKLFDTQQVLFARRLLSIDINEVNASRLNPGILKKMKHGHLDGDALAFAVYAANGKMLMSDGKNGSDIPGNYLSDGFENGHLNDDDDEWRFLWLTAPTGKYRIVVGQQWGYRREMATDIVISQLTPWLVALPVMMLLMIVLLSRELHPLKKLAQTLRNRQPDATEKIAIERIPSEARPLVDALNQLFTRTHEMMIRERQFTSDAAHELRSPLAALKVQTEVAQLSVDDRKTLDKALNHIHAGVDRASRLVEQLLTLSRLDSLENLEDIGQIPVAGLLQSVAMDVYHFSQRAGIELRLTVNASEVSVLGQPLLLGLLVRNLLDNAVRYSPRGSIVNVTLYRRGFSVRDNGPGTSDQVLQRLGERFYRPAGQDETGAGLGLSIVKRIAALHGMWVSFGNVPEGGFMARVEWALLQI